MTAVSLTHNITRQEDFEGSPGGSIGSIGGGPSAVAEAGLHIQGSQCLARRIGGTGSERGFTYIHGDIGTVDMLQQASGVMLAKTFTALSAVIETPGNRVGIGDTTSAYYNYMVGDDGTMGDGPDFPLPPKGGYVITPIEVRVSAWHNLTRVGSPDLTITDMIRMSHQVSATTGAGTSQALDSIDYTGDGLFLVGGDGADADGTFADFVDADEGGGLSGADNAGLWTSNPAGIIGYLTNYIGEDNTGVIFPTVFTDEGFSVTFPGGFVSENKNGLQFNLGHSDTNISLSDATIRGSNAGFGGRSYYKEYFDTELDVTGGATDTINFPSHSFRNGDQVQYSAEGGSQDIGPDASTGEAEFATSAGVASTSDRWYVIVNDADSIQLSSTAANAFSASPTAQNLTPSSSGLGERHSLTRTPDTRPNLTFVHTSGTASCTRLNLSQCHDITLNSAVTLTDCVIGQCHELVLSDVDGGATMTGAIITSPTIGVGESFIKSYYAEHLDDFDASITSSGKGHAIEIQTDGTVGQNTTTLSNTTFTGYFASDGDNTGGWEFNSASDVDPTNDDITITSHGFSTGDPVYYSDEGGIAVGGLTDQELYYLRSLDANTVAVYLTREAAETDTNRIQLTVSLGNHKFYSANAAIFNNTGGDVTINVSGGDSPTVRNSAGSTTTVQNTVTIRVEGLTEGSACKCIANETAGSLTQGDTIFQKLADSNGVAEETGFNYEAGFGSGLDVIIRAANQGFANAAIADDGGVFTDETENANSTTTDDMTILPASPAVNDAYYFGHNEEFSQLKLELSQDGVGTWTIVWEYWNGSSWAALSGVTDGTSGFTTDGIVSWTIPGDWDDTTINSQGPFRYVRARLSAFTSLTTQPLGRKCTLDVTRYLPFSQNRVVTSAGLTVFATWTEDIISQFS